MSAKAKQLELNSASAVTLPRRAPRWIMPLVRSALLLADAALALACFISAFIVREAKPVLQHGPGMLWNQDFIPYAALLPFVLLIRLVMMRYYDLYRLRGEFSLVDDGIKLFKAVGTGSLLIVSVAFLFRGGVEFRAFSYARAVFLYDFLFAFAGYGLVRLSLRAGQMLVRAREINLIPTLVVGRGAEASVCIRELTARRTLGYRVIGVVATEPIDSTVAPRFEDVPVVGDLASLGDLIRDTRANEVIITDATVPSDLLFDVMMNCGRRRGVEFRVAPNLFNSLPHKTDVDQIGALPMIRLFREPLSDASRVVKRAFDLVLAGTATLLLTPVWVLICLLIKFDSSGPALFRQERVGMDGRVFLFLKFRTMTSDSDDAAHRAYLQKYIAGAGENLGDDAGPVFKLKGDARVTRVGSVLRRLSLDELPQLLNVLRGDMSIVGPRPPIAYEVEAYELWHRRRLDMKPGITGLWQVSGRNRLTFDEMVRLDLFYIEHWSPLLDMKIILMTVPTMLRGDGAR